LTREITVQIRAKAWAHRGDGGKSNNSIMLVVVLANKGGRQAFRDLDI